MALNQERLAGPASIATTASATTPPASGSGSYTVGSGVTTIVKQIILSNITTETITVTIWLKPSATAYASMGNGNILFYDYAVEPNNTSLLNLSLVMDAGDILYARASAASSVNLTINGLEES